MIHTPRYVEFACSSISMSVISSGTALGSAIGQDRYFVRIFLPDPRAISPEDLDAPRPVEIIGTEVSLNIRNLPYAYIPCCRYPRVTK
jgi:hypothetical protein